MFRLRFSSFGVLKEIFNLLILSARKMWKSRNLSDRVMKELRVLRNNISSAVEKLNIGNVRYIDDEAEKGRAVIKIGYIDKENTQGSMDIELEYWDNELEVTVDNRRAGRRNIKVFKDADAALSYIKAI